MLSFNFWAKSLIFSWSDLDENEYLGHSKFSAFLNVEFGFEVAAAVVADVDVVAVEVIFDRGVTNCSLSSNSSFFKKIKIHFMNLIKECSKTFFTCFFVYCFEIWWLMKLLFVNLSFLLFFRVCLLVLLAASSGAVEKHA
jgi:hypothetical protein